MLAVKLISGLMLMCDLVLGQPNGEATKPGQVVQKVSSDKVHNGGRKGPMSGATNTGNVAPIPILIPFPIIPVQGQQGGQVMTPSQGQGQGQASTTTTPVIGQAGAMNAPQGGQAAQAGGNAASQASQPGQAKKKKKKVSKSTEKTKSETRKISVRKELKENRSSKTKRKEKVKHGGVRASRDTSGEEYEKEFALAQLPSMLRVREQLTGRRQVRQVDGDKVQNQKVEDMLKNLNNTVTPLSSLINTTNIPSSNISENNSRPSTGNLLLDTPAVAVESIPSLLALLGKPLSGRPSVMFIEKVTGKTGDLIPIPSIKSTLQQSSTLPINNNNNNGSTDASSPTNKSTKDDMEHTENVTENSLANFYKEVPVINVTESQASLLPSSERQNLASYLKNYPFSLEVHGDNKSTIGNAYTPLVLTLDKQTNLPLPQGSDLESYLKNIYLVNVTAYPPAALENTTTEITTTTLKNVSSAVDTTLNQNGVISQQERKNLADYLQSRPEVAFANTTDPTQADSASVKEKEITVNETLTENGIIPLAERKALDDYLSNLTEAPAINTTTVDDVAGSASIMNATTPTIINVTSTLIENSTISSEDRTNVATFLQSRANANATNEVVGSEEEVPIDYRNINASVFRTKETVNETLNKTANENRTSGSFSNMTSDENPEQAGTRSLLNAFLITAAMKESNAQSAQKPETAAHETHDSVEKLPANADGGSKLAGDKTEKKVDAMTSSTSSDHGMNASTSMDTDYTGSRSDMVNTTNEEGNGINASYSSPSVSNTTLSVGNKTNVTEGHQDSPPAYLTLMAKKYNASIVFASNASEVLPSATKSSVEGNSSLSNGTGTEPGTVDDRYAIKTPSNDTALLNSNDNQWNTIGGIQLANVTNGNYSLPAGESLFNESSMDNSSFPVRTSPLLTDAGFSFIVGTNTSSASSPTNSSVEKGNSTIDIENSTPVRKKPVTNSLAVENAPLIKAGTEMGESILAGNSTGFRSSLSNVSVSNDTTSLNSSSISENATLVNSSMSDNKTSINLSVAENATKSDESSDGDGTMTNVVTLISNLTQVNASEYLANLTETGIASIAKLIGSLNGLTMGLVEAANASLLEEEREPRFNNSLHSAGDLNHTILERITNEWNYNDTLLVKLVEYFQAMNLTENPELWGISANDSLGKRVQSYVDAMTSTNATTVQSLEDTTELLDSAKKVPVIKSLLEKGRTTLEKQLGTPIDNRQVATIVNKFINWRDQSFSHKCLKDILAVREVNECFSNIAECRDTNATHRRNVISNLRNFFTCRDRRKLNKNVIVVGNYTMRRQRNSHHEQHFRTKINGTKENIEDTEMLEKKKNHENDEDDKKTDKMKSLAEILNVGMNRKEENDEGEGEVKGALQEALAEDDCGDSISSLEKCELKRIEDLANLTREDIKEDKESASVVHDIVWPAAAEHAAALPQHKGKEMSGAKNKLTPKGGSKKNKTKEEICDDGSDCFKMQLAKFIEEKCKQYEDAYGKCKKQHKDIKEESSESRSDTNTNDTNAPCMPQHKDLTQCHNETSRWKKEFQVAQCQPESRSGLSDDELPERCFIVNHLEATTFSGHIEKADIVRGEKTVDGSRNETTYNATTDFFPGNDSYTLNNQTTYRSCEGCLNNNQNNNDTENFLSFNQENTEPNSTVTLRDAVGSGNATTPLSNTTKDGDDVHGGEGTSLKKFEISKSPLECSDPGLLLMLTSQDDDDRETARLECHGGVKKRELISKHVTTHNKKTAADGTVTKDKTSDSTKVTDQDTGKEVKPSSAPAPEEHRKIEDSGRVNTNEHAENHKVLDDILSGKYLDEVKEGFDQRKPESSENHTMRIDPSMLSEKDPRHDHDPENPDADVGIVGREPEAENSDATKTNANDGGKENNVKTDKKKEESQNNGKEEKKGEEKKKGKEEYWLHGVNGDKTTNTKDEKNNDKEEDKPKDLDKNAKKILCFGDSLTKGYYRHGRAYHPYSIKLESLLKEDGINAKVINHGVNGECVALEMQRRLARDLEQLPDLALVIILGGTNDLLNLDCVRKLDLFQEIKNLHMLVRAKGYKSVIVTIPEAKAARLGTDTMSLIEYRKELDTTNQRLRMYAVATRLPIIDLADLFTRHSVDGKPIDGAAMWDDDIHPSREGYDRIGEIVYEKVKYLL